MQVLLCPYILQRQFILHTGMSATNGTCSAGYYCSGSSITATPISQAYGEYLTLCMLGNFFKYFFSFKDAKNHCFLPNILMIYNLNVKQLGSQMKPHIL